MSTTESIPPSPPSFVERERHAATRALRVLALLILTLGLGLVGSLFLFSLFPSLHRLFGELMTTGQNRRWPSLDAGIPVALALLVLTPLAFGYAFRRWRPHSFRGWVFLGLFAASLLVANLVLVALFPSVREGVEAIVWLSFWKASGAAVGLVSFTLLTLGVVAWRLRPSSLRGFVRFGLTIGFILTLDLVLVALCPSLLDSFQGFPRPFLDYNNSETFGLLVLAAALITFTPLAVLITAWRLRLHSWRWIGGGYLVLAPVLAYLAADDPVIRRPMTMDEIAPAFPGAENSFAVLLRYGNQHPLGRAFRSPSQIWKKPMTAGEAFDTSKPAEWQAFLTGHRSDIEADWAALAPVRAWWAELNAFDRIGDLTPPRGDAEIIAFSPPRSMSQLGCAIASLQALDGHGDEAVDTLLPIIQVGRKLQPSARTLVREMIGIIVERMGLQTAAFVLDHAAVSPAARARLTAALSAGGGGAPGARRLMAIEYAFSLNYALGKPFGTLIAPEGSTVRRLALNAIGPFVYNPRATFNLRGDFVADEQELVANRQFDRLASRTKTFFTQEARPRFKNFAGTLLIGLSIPAMSKVAESYWNTQDTRAALLARLTKS